MLTLRPTVALSRRLRLPSLGGVPNVPNRAADWCAHSFTADRFRYLFFCHTATLYPVITSARGVTDDASLIRAFQTAVRLALSTGSHAFLYERWIGPALSVQFAPISDRSLLSSINELICHAKYLLRRDELSAVELGAYLAETPMSFLGGNSPDLAFASFHPTPEPA